MTLKLLLAAALLAMTGCATTPTTPTTTATTTAPPLLDPAALPMTSAVWRLSARAAAFGTHLGRPAVHLHGGFAHLRDVVLRDGTIDVDIAADDGVTFAGIAWHLQDEGTFDKFYLRPFLSGGREASQYTPWFNHISGWQTWHGPNFNRPVVVHRGRWTHVRIVLAGQRAEIFVDDMTTPLLHVDPLRFDAKDGGVALSNERVADVMPTVGAWFSNVRVTPATTPPALVGKVPVPVVSEPGRVPAFFVSAPFAAEALSDTAPAATSLTWTRLATEDNGLANLARLAPVGPGSDTVYARVIVRSDVARRARVRFGFSERVRIYVDGRSVFDADATFHKRDITFQGVVGLNDALSLDLRAGETELWCAVSENLIMRGGWAVQAVFDDITGLTFVEPIRAAGPQDAVRPAEARSTTTTTTATTTTAAAASASSAITAATAAPAATR